MATVLIVLGIPLLLVSSAVRSVTMNESFYLHEFARYGVGQVTGFSEAELSQVAQAFIQYFSSGDQTLNAQVSRSQGTIVLFNEREIAHMQDVQSIMQVVFRAGWLALVLLLLGGGAVALFDRGAALSTLILAAGVGGGITAILIGLLALGSFVDFGRLFLLFHSLSFANDLWLLDPSRDRLIQLFPQGFFFDAAIQIGLRSGGIGALMALVSFIGLRVLP